MSLKAVPSSAKAAELAELVEQINARLQAGEPLDPEEILRAHPEHAKELKGLLPAIAQLADLSRSASRTAAPTGGVSPERLAGYRILREIGRGGMGVVYEAEHESLGRRVALKILHLHAGQDPRLMARFRRESRAAAQLHHTNIVPVFEVGQQGELCYYAMQFIRGQALDEVFRELQRLRTGSAFGAITDGALSAGSLAHALRAGALEPAGSACDTMAHEPTDTPVASAPPPPAAPPPTAAWPDHSELSSVASDFRLYCRNVARLGLQAAEALAYAHGRGIVHRDIKPANLLLDTTGVLWVSDFGLVKTQDPALTDTGDLVGTLRYMAPEHFRGECDARADVYALGLTLYELLVLRPAFDGQDRMHLVDQIGHQEPARPRVLDSRIPRDLETILMKAIEKEPRRRYPSAEALAGDLRRYLADEPIQARRIGPLERLGRWGRRNPLVASLSAAVVLVTALGFAAVFGQLQVAQANEREANQQRDEARALAEKLQTALEQLRRTTYAAHMNLAKHAWEEGDSGRVLELLEQQRPKPEEPDLRNFEWHYLDRLCHCDLLTLKGHTDHVSSVAYSPDGKRLASAAAGSDRTVKVWDAQTGQVLLSFKGSTGQVWSVAFSPDGKRLASAAEGAGNTVKVWDAQTGEELLSFKGKSRSVAFSPDGKRLASASSDNTMKVWDTQTGQELLTCKGHTAFVESVAFSPDGKRLASGAWDNTVKVWDAQSGQQLLSLEGHTKGVDCVTFSLVGKRLASASVDNTVKVWDAQTGQELLSLKGAGEKVAFSPDGKRLASASSDNTVKVWDTQTGQELLNLKGGGHNVAFSPDGKRLASGSVDNTVKVWDAQKVQENLTLQGDDEQSVAFSPDGRRLASASLDGTVKVWDAQTGQPTLTLKGHTVPVMSVAISPDGKRVASGGGGQRHPGGGHVVSKGDRAEVKVWDAQTGQESLTLQRLTGTRVSSVAWSPDGKRLASAFDYDGIVKVWNVQTGQELLSLKVHPSPGIGVAFSPDGKRLASSGVATGGAPMPGEAQVHVWDAQTGQEFLTLKGGGRSVAFSPDGKRLASGAKVWDVQTGQEVLTLKGGGGSVAFSPDGKRLASAGGERLKVWDARTGQELLTLKVDTGGTGAIASVAFSPDGHRLASAGGPTVTIWDATPLPAKP
jgi:WD40 repeat protein/serine/threonine protein kinase